MLEIIKNNNPATLIGSLDSTQLSQYTTYDNYCSYSTELDKPKFTIPINKILQINEVKYDTIKSALPPQFFKDGKKKKQPRKRRSPK